MLCMQLLAYPLTPADVPLVPDVLRALRQYPLQQQQQSSG
jgi:hypothetical protein